MYGKSVANPMGRGTGQNGLNLPWSGHDGFPSFGRAEDTGSQASPRGRGALGLVFPAG